MRIIFKFSAALMACICCILGIGTYFSWARGVEFFEKDMRLDHNVVGAAIASMVERTWAEQGRTAADEVPRVIAHGGRRLSLFLLDPVASPPGHPELTAAVLQTIGQGEPASIRDRSYQRSFVPVRGPAGARAVLEVREPLSDEQSYSTASLQRAVNAVLAMLLVCGVLTFWLGMLWVGKPIRQLCDAARRIGRGDLTTSLSIAGRSELSTLAEEMSDMSRALQHAGQTLAHETEKRIATLEQLRHADRLSTVGKLAAGVAHELGTPLNVVWANASMIKSGELVGRELTEGAEAIAAQAQRMTRIIRQLLDFARPRAVLRAPTDLVGLAGQTLQFLESMAQKRAVGLDLQASATAVMADVDAVQIQQVLTNLVVNAIQATPAGGSVTVAIAAVEAESPPEHGSRRGWWHRLEVRDTGSGIAPEVLPHLFEPFYTTKGVGEGTGLGLSVSRGIVGEHGGWIAVRSAPGEGACFSVFLPRTGVEVADAR